MAILRTSPSPSAYESHNPAPPQLDVAPAWQAIGDPAFSEFFPDASPAYQRYKPGVGATIAFVRADGSPAGYLRLFDNDRRAAEVYAKARTLRLETTSTGLDVARLPHGVAFAFPNDMKVRDLRWVANLRKLRQTLAPMLARGEKLNSAASEMRFIRYKPERRFVADVRAVIDTEGVPVRNERVFVRFTAAPGSGAARRPGGRPRRGRCAGTAAPFHGPSRSAVRRSGSRRR